MSRRILLVPLLLLATLRLAAAPLPAGWYELGEKLYAAELDRQPETRRRVARQNTLEGNYTETEAMCRRFPFKQLFSPDPPELSTPQWRSAVVERDAIRRSGWTSEQVREVSMKKKVGFEFGGGFPDPAGRLSIVAQGFIMDYPPQIHPKDRPGVAAENDALFRYLVTKACADYRRFAQERPRMLASTPPLPVPPMPKNLNPFYRFRFPQPAPDSPEGIAIKEYEAAWTKMLNETGYYGHQSYLYMMNDIIREQPMMESYTEHIYFPRFIAKESGGDPGAMIELLHRAGYTSRAERKAWFDRVKAIDVSWPERPLEDCNAPKVEAFLAADKTDLPSALQSAAPATTPPPAPAKVIPSAAPAAR